MDRRSLRDSLLECVDDLEGITKQVVESLLNRDKHSKEGETLTNLVVLYEGKQKDMKTLARKIPEYQEREKLIRQLKSCVDERDKIINHVESILRSAETAIMKSVYRSNRRLQSVRHSEVRPVESEEVIKFAHQISRGYSIAAPHYWQQGDQMRPFPTEAEFQASRLATPRAAPTSSSINMIRQTTNSNIRTPPIGLRMTSPMVTSNVNKAWGSPSPRPSFASSSPRGRPLITTPGGSSRGSESSLYNGKKYNNGSPQISSPNMAISIQSTVARPMQQIMAVETMISSDSSSSSSSEDEGQS